MESSSINLQSSLPDVGSKYQETEAQTDACGVPCECKAELTKKTLKHQKLKHQKERQKFCLANISHDDSKICFYTGFPSYLALKACYSFLGPAITSLSYSSKTEGRKFPCGHLRNLSKLICLNNSALCIHLHV